MTDAFKDRRDAGRRLARAVLALQLVRPLVLALPRGGAAVADEIAIALQAPLDLLIVRKIGAPGQPELAVAAVGEGAPPTQVVDARLARLTGADGAYIESRARHQHAEIERRRLLYRRGAALTAAAGRNVVVVDDGIATGTTMRAALQIVRAMAPARLVLAVPVAAPEALAGLAKDADDVVCLLQPPGFDAVGAYYDDFEQVEDAEVVAILDAARQRPYR